MLAKYILAVLAVAFLAAGASRDRRTSQRRTWLTIAAIFAAVSLWLFAKS